MEESKPKQPKHTPGPWEENSALAAAAPELLECLKEAMKCAAEWKEALRNAREIRDRLMDAIRQGAGEDHGKI